MKAGTTTERWRTEMKGWRRRGGREREEEEREKGT
jgi:hypothetical protein